MSTHDGSESLFASLRKILLEHRNRFSCKSYSSTSVNKERRVYRALQINLMLAPEVIPIVAFKGIPIIAGNGMVSFFNSSSIITTVTKEIFLFNIVISCSLALVINIATVFNIATDLP